MLMDNTTMQITKTITSLFILPILGIGKDDLMNNGFLNAFSKEELRDEKYKDCIYLLFKPTDLDRFREFLERENGRKAPIIDDFDLPKGFVVLVYKLDESYKHDYKLVRKGKYSQTSKEYQDLFPKVAKIMINGLHRDELSLQLRVFRKTPDLIEFWEKEFDVTFDENQELWFGYDNNKETLTKEKLE
jgi:hypothetical protein